jgi:glyoxylase-like metal-dependent hydrolase (beta-lactamase superfamily II)
LLSHNGPQLLPAVFSHDQDGCIRSLAALALLDTEILIPGHGGLWRGPIREAAKQATALAQLPVTIGSRLTSQFFKRR